MNDSTRFCWTVLRLPECSFQESLKTTLQPHAFTQSSSKLLVIGTIYAILSGCAPVAYWEQYSPDNTPQPTTPITLDNDATLRAKGAIRQRLNHSSQMIDPYKESRSWNWDAQRNLHVWVPYGPLKTLGLYLFLDKPVSAANSTIELIIENNEGIPSILFLPVPTRLAGAVKSGDFTYIRKHMTGIKITGLLQGKNTIRFPVSIFSRPLSGRGDYLHSEEKMAGLGFAWAGVGNVHPDLIKEGRNSTHFTGTAFRKPGFGGGDFHSAMRVAEPGAKAIISQFSIIEYPVGTAPTNIIIQNRTTTDR